MQKPFYVTTPIYYVNGSPHFAHAYTTTIADIFARFNRLDGRRVHFLTGTDEHGQKVAQAARAKNLTPQLFCDEVSSEFREMNRLMNISNDDFIRTTEERHVRSCKALWKKLSDRGEIYLGRFGGFYSVRDEAYFEGSELINGKAPTGAPVEWIEEENFFFRLSQWQKPLLHFYERNPEFIAPEGRRREVVSFVESGLRDLSISRTTINWGIPVPDAPHHVMYVWIDALTNYVTGAGYPDTSDGAPLWPADLHLIGKDIIRFHCVYWPAILMAAGLTPPARVFAHGWWTVAGDKMSKSLDNFIPPRVLVDRYGLDEVRYFMARELTLGSDGDLNEAALDRRVAGELRNGLGNLVHRTLTMIDTYCGGNMPEPAVLSTRDSELISLTGGLLPAMRDDMTRQALQSAIGRVWDVIATANRYVVEQEPWQLAKTDSARLNTVLFVLAEILRVIGIVMQPVIPEAAGRLLDLLSVPNDRRDFAAIDGGSIPPGTALPKPQVIFPKREDATQPSLAMEKI